MNTKLAISRYFNQTTFERQNPRVVDGDMFANCCVCKNECNGRGFSHRFQALIFYSDDYPSEQSPNDPVFIQRLIDNEKIFYVCDPCFEEKGIEFVDGDQVTIGDGLYTHSFTERVND